MSVSSVKATIAGQVYDLLYNATNGRYEATITAPQRSSYKEPGHYYSVDITAEDHAGNQTSIDADSAAYGEYLKLIVKEKNAPVQVITYPTENASITSNRPVIRWYVNDDDSGVDPSTIAIQIDGKEVITGSAISKEAATDGYVCRYTSTSLDEGVHTIVVLAEDYDGNKASHAPVRFTVDTVPPTLSIESPSENYMTNASELIVRGVTNDITSSPVTVTVKLNSGPEESVTADNTGVFSKLLTLTEGLNTITVKARDRVGNTSTVTRTVTLDTVPPTFGFISIVPNPADAGNTFIISVEVGE